ncbi:MAG: galactose mutarotase [Microbacterium sp.]|uniref:aldose epimerase family protein n=1 Tax=Microbacterium sp. TaxID=51671 RepID=UPI0025DA2EF1|nr:aldose epimerase family protein [Microbacterium sp.]MBQ9918512.1 galactose mutarotase [Microbacterium sp.]
MSAGICIEDFGVTASGATVQRALLRNDVGASVAILSYGGTIQRIDLPGDDGPTNVVLGYATLAEYEACTTYFGAFVGRYANRIADAGFGLDGIRFELDRNDDFGTVHGGSAGFDRRVWQMREVGTPDGVAVELRLQSPDGDSGFPGTLDVVVRYVLARDAPTLRWEARARTDAATVVNLTGHSYFQLAGEGKGSVLDHVLQIDADAYLPVDERLLPTGEFAPVEGSPFDFREPTRIGERIRDAHEQLLRGQGYDHNYVLRPGGGELRRAARLTDPASARWLEVWTTEPGLDVYTGNFLDGSDVGPRGRIYRQGDGIALEPEHFTDSPNRPHFPSTVLRPGEVYRTATEYRFGREPRS